MSRACRIVLLVAGLACLIGLGALAFISPSAHWTDFGGEPRDSHARMVWLMAKIRDDDLANNPLYSTEVMRKTEAELQALPRKALLEDRIDLHTKLGNMQLLVGENRAAVDQHEQAANLLLRLLGRVPQKTHDTALMNVAIAYLRCAETENCLEACTCESCILPIRGGGIHTRQDGSRKAVKALNELLASDPNNLTARWLLNIAAMTLGEYPDQVPNQFLIPPEAFASKIPFPRFVNVAAAVGLNAVSLAGSVVADDFDNDGWIDLMTSDWGPAGQLRLFQNTRKGTFVERTREAGLDGLLGGLNLVQADYDNDGHLDVYVVRGAWRGTNGLHPDSLLRNDGQAHFRDVTFDVGLGEVHYPSQTAAWSDYDLDGDLDLYVGNETYPCQLFENDGHGSFTDIAERAGVTNRQYTKGVTWGDFNADRYPDLYVSNYGTPKRLLENDSSSTNLFDSIDGAPNRLYRNNRDGTFTDIAVDLGVTRPLLGFPTWFWDVNNDGFLDLFAASYSGTVREVAAEYLGLSQSSQPDCLYLADGKGGFREVGAEYGLNRVSLAMGANFGDLNNDGFDDFYLGTGAPEYESLVPNIMYLNQAGESFADITAAGGFGHLQKGHGVAFADIDNDGDQDVIAVMGGAFGADVFSKALFENPGFDNHWIKIKLVGSKSNRSAIGSRIQVDIEEEGKPRSIFKWVNSGGSFGANPLRKEVGLGKAARIRRLQIYWPASDTTQEFRDLPVDTVIEVAEGSAEYRVVTPAAR